MTLSSEQIKQTVVEIREIMVDPDDFGVGEHVRNCGWLLEITDHLQKTIEAQAADIESLNDRIDQLEEMARCGEL